MRRRAFTLIELLVVISIIAVLAAVSMPAAQRARSQARTVACRSNLRQWAFATTAYANDHNGKLPGSWWQGWNGYASLLESYVRDHEPLNLCPSATRHRQDSPLSNCGDKSHAWWVDFDGPGDLYSPIKGSYAFNEWIENWSEPRGLSGLHPLPENEVLLWRAHVAKCWQTLDVRGAYRIPLLADCAQFLHPRDTDNPPAYEGDVLLTCSEVEIWGVSRDSIKHVCIDRHNAGVNMAFLDASARKVELKELWTFRWNRQYDTANVWTRAGGVLSEDWPVWMRKLKEY